MNYQTLTRTQLYELVWKEPMSEVAPRLGISDVALAKLCRKRDIPVPPRGYWAKLKHGKRVKRPALPVSSNPQNDRIVIDLRERPTFLKRDELPADIRAAVDRLQAEEEAITFRPQLRKLHPVFADARRTTAIERRLLQLMDAVLREVGARGGHAESFKGNNLRISLFGEKLELLVVEDNETVQVPTTEYERKWRYPNQETKPVSKPNGQVRIRILNSVDRPLRREWHDREGATVEQQFREFLLGLCFATAAVRESRLKNEERQRRWEDEWRQRAKREERQRRVQERLQKLRSQAMAWREAETIREFLAAMSAKHSSESSNEDMTPWETWARSAADALDPTITKVHLDDLDA